MKKLLLIVISLLSAFITEAQNTLEVIDSGYITRELWRDSLFRMDMNQVPSGFLLEYSMFGFDSDKYDGIGNNDDTIRNKGRIFELHNILWYSKVNSNAIIDITDSLFSKAFFENRNNSTTDKC